MPTRTARLALPASWYLTNILGGVDTVLRGVSAAHDRLPRRYTNSAIGAASGRWLGQLSNRAFRSWRSAHLDWRRRCTAARSEPGSVQLCARCGSDDPLLRGGTDLPDGGSEWCRHSGHDGYQLAEGEHR